MISSLLTQIFEQLKTAQGKSTIIPWKRGPNKANPNTRTYIVTVEDKRYFIITKNWTLLVYETELTADKLEVTTKEDPNRLILTINAKKCKLEDLTVFTT